MVSLKPASGSVKIHNVRFYNLTPRSINYLAYNAATGRLAVSRTDASIEIWNMLHAGYLEQTILGLPQSSVEAVGWAATDRLFSTGHTGELTEWNLRTLLPKQSVLLTGNAAWCLCVNRRGDHIAVGTEEGYLNIYAVDADGLNYVKIFDKQEGRILCARYDHTGDLLVTGSIDCLRIWDVKTGHAIHRMATGRAEAQRETIVWSLAVLRDLTIISGDSRGRITIWDGKLGAQRESFAALRADVLSVAVNEEETVFSCSGIDPVIKMYALTAVKRDQVVTNTWIKYIQRAVHDHDIKALTFGAAGQVYSGGIDGYLGVSVSAKSSKQTLLKYGPFLPQPCAVVAPQKRLLLLKYFNYVEVWRLGQPTEQVQLCDEDAAVAGKFLSLERGLEKLVELRAYRDQPVVTASLSPDGAWLAYSTETTVRLFRLRVRQDEQVQMQRCRAEDLPAEFGECLHLRFAHDSRRVFLVKRDGVVEVFRLAGGADGDGAEAAVERCGTVDTRRVVRGTVCAVQVAQDGQWLVVVGTCGTIAVWRWAGEVAEEAEAEEAGGWRHYLNLPKYKLAPTAIALHAGKPVLVAAFSDSKIFEYHLEEMRFTCSSHKAHVDNVDTHAVNNIVLDPNNENIIMLHNDTFLYVLEKQLGGSGGGKKGAKAARMALTNGKAASSDADEADEEPVADLRLKFSKKFEHFVHLSRLSDDGELVAVGVNPVTLIEQLPPSMRQKKFGAA